MLKVKQTKVIELQEYLHFRQMKLMVQDLIELVNLVDEIFLMNLV
jgi:hypothetical protein